MANQPSLARSAIETSRGRDTIQLDPKTAQLLNATLLTGGGARQNCSVHFKMKGCKITQAVVQAREDWQGHTVEIHFEAEKYASASQCNQPCCSAEAIDATEGFTIFSGAPEKATRPAKPPVESGAGLLRNRRQEAGQASHQAEVEEDYSTDTPVRERGPSPLAATGSKLKTWTSSFGEIDREAKKSCMKYGAVTGLFLATAILIGSRVFG